MVCQSVKTLLGVRPRPLYMGALTRLVRAITSVYIPPLLSLSRHTSLIVGGQAYVLPHDKHYARSVGADVFIQTCVFNALLDNLTLRSRSLDSWYLKVCEMLYIF